MAPSLLISSEPCNPENTLRFRFKLASAIGVDSVRRGVLWAMSRRFYFMLFVRFSSKRPRASRRSVTRRLPRIGIVAVTVSTFNHSLRAAAQPLGNQFHRKERKKSDASSSIAFIER